MYIDFNTEKIKKVLSDFRTLSGIDIDIIRSDFTAPDSLALKFNSYCKAIQSCPEGARACRKSDLELLERCRESKKPQIKLCHAGLLDVAVPVIFDGEILCYLILGQMKKEADFKKIQPLIKNLPITSKIDFCKLYHELDFFDESKMLSVVSIAEIVAKYILVEDLIILKSDAKTESATEYINRNYAENLSVEALSKVLHISKSSLYEMFRKNFGCTVSGYINSVRIQKATVLLQTTDLPIEEISRRTGFSKASYFTRIFKSVMNTTPLKYRKKTY